MTRSALLAVLLAAGSMSAACATAVTVRTDHPAEAPEATADFSCSAQVEALGRAVEGFAEAAGTGEGLEEEASQKACLALRTSGGPDCGDSEHVVRSVATSLRIINGKASASISVRLRPVTAVLEGAGRAATDAVAACRSAVGDACAKAAAGDLCSAADVACKEVQPGVLRCVPIRLTEDDPKAYWRLEADEGPFDRL